MNHQQQVEAPHLLALGIAFGRQACDMAGFTGNITIQASLIAQPA